MPSLRTLASHLGRGLLSSLEIWLRGRMRGFVLKDESQDISRSVMTT
jgi:hypothetical protein